MDAVGPYRIIAKLGAGGMGEVYLAEDTRLERRVALKWLRDPSLTGPEARQRVRDEARAAARLTHPNIAAVHDVIDTPSGPAIVMEYVEGASLASRIADGPLPAPEVVTIGVQLADALAAAHAHGVIHRDLKPGNVSLASDGRVKILDFGIARIRGLGTTAVGAPPTRDAPMVGTAGYCAPEQWLSGVADERSDLFSLGILLFEMCTGGRPLAAAYGQAPAPRADSVNPAVPAALATAIDRLLQIDPALRPSSAREVATDLTRLSEGASAGSQRTVASRALVAAVAAAVIVAAGMPFLARARTGAARSGPPVVAVLPFHADSEADAPLAAGLDQSLASDLALMPGLVTVSRDAVAEYRGGHKSVADIGRAVGAEYLVDGDVRPAGGDWLLDVRLVHAGREGPVWRRQYTTSAEGLLAVRERISDDLAAALGSDAGLPRGARRAPTDNAEAFTHYSQGIAFLDRRDIPGNLDRAVRLFQSAVEKDRRFALAHAGLAQAHWEKYAQQREPDLPRLAERAILEAVTLEPDHPSVRYTAAVIFNGTGRADRAVEELQRVLATHPNDAAYRLLADMTARRGDVSRALQYADRAIELRPDFWENHGARGMVCLRAGRFDEARASFQRVIDLQPDSAWGHQLLGATYQNLGRVENALESYRRSLDLAPTPATLSNIATIHYSAGRYKEAAAAYERALALRPNDPRLHRNAGDTYARVGDRARARDAYRNAVRLLEQELHVNPGNGSTLALLALLEAKLGRHEAAAAHSSQAIARADRDPEVWYRRAVVLNLRGDAMAALAALREAVALGYAVAVARDDDDLRTLRSRPEFRAIVSQEE